VAEQDLLSDQRLSDQILSVNPATGEVVGRFTAHGPEQVAAAVAAASAAFSRWRRATLDERGAILRVAAELLRQRTDDYARLVTREMGKPITQAKVELGRCADHFDFYAGHAADFLRDEAVITGAERSFIAYEPLGPVLAVMPWNFPFSQVSRFAAAALMAGNTCLLKHASNVSGCALAIEQVLTDAGLPPGVFRTLLLPASRVRALIEDPRIRAVTVTGSSEAGAKIAAAAGGALKKCVLELGGSDPFVVLADADLAKAAAGAAQTRLSNSGQACAAGKRFIVERSVAREFEDLFARAIAARKVGDPADPATEVGPLARGDLVDTLARQVDESVAMGARVVLGGQRRPGPGSFYEPTLLADCTPDMPVCREETFGPVAALVPAADADAAIDMANDTPYGLAASVWAGDLDLAGELARRIDAGSVFINGVVTSDPRMPFGGVKRSGFGRENGQFGIREFVNVQAVVVGGYAARDPRGGQ
jgi:succinate-semialdehyde dehydrogenase/glutarate-semialdehyde dehydrogenase